MLLDIQTPAAPAATPHKHDFSAIDTFNMPNEAFSTTLQYLQDRIQTLSGIITSRSPVPESEPDPPTTDEASEDIHVHEPEVATSVTTEVAIPSKRRNTSFSFAHPPPAPKARALLKVRPPVLLQLHQLSDNRRSKPFIDVLPSTKFAPKLAKRFQRLNGSLGVDDLLLVKSQSYEVELDGDNNEDMDGKEIIAAICQPRRRETELQGQTEIYMSRGAPWLASARANGNYEFVCLGEDGVTTRARWLAPRRSKQYPKKSAFKDKTFRFSILAAGARRHPIIATMDRRSISIVDQYTIPDTLTGSPTSITTESSGLSYFEKEQGDKPLIDTDEDLRMLVMVTGVWVSFVEGWSENFKYNDQLMRASSVQRSPTSGSIASPKFDQSSIPTPKSFASAKSRRETLEVLQRSPINEEPSTPSSHHHHHWSTGSLSPGPSNFKLRSSMSLHRTKSPAKLTDEQKASLPRSPNESFNTSSRRSTANSRNGPADLEVADTPTDGSSRKSPILTPNLEGILPEDFEDSPTDCESVTRAPEATSKLVTPAKNKFRPFKRFRNMFHGKDR